MKHKPKKIDKRYNGSDSFKYLIDINKSTMTTNVFYPALRLTRMNEFVKIREWAWESWGPSCEIAFYRPLGKDSVWSWDNENNNRRIYLKSEKELSWFLLKWTE